MTHGDDDRIDRAQQLRRARMPFVHATVVRAAAADLGACPATRRSCWPTARSRASSAATARRARCARRRSDALQTGESVLLRVLPDGDVHFPEAPGAQRRGQPVPVRRRAGDLPRADAAGAAGAGRRRRRRSPTRWSTLAPAARLRRSPARAGQRDPAGADRGRRRQPRRRRGRARSGPRSTPASATSAWWPAATRGAAVLDELDLTDERARPGAHARSGWTSAPGPPRRSRCRSWPRSCAAIAGRRAARRARRRAATGVPRAGRSTRSAG